MNTQVKNIVGVCLTDVIREVKFGLEEEKQEKEKVQKEWKDLLALTLHQVAQEWDQVFSGNTSVVMEDLEKVTLQLENPGKRQKRILDCYLCSSHVHLAVTDGAKDFYKKQHSWDAWRIMPSDLSQSHMEKLLRECVHEILRCAVSAYMKG